MGPAFPFQLPYTSLNLRDRPDLYRIGKGEQGVLSVEPYKSELLPHWRFKDPETAEVSSKALRAKFDTYRDQGDFVGCDMARKFVQMGYTRSRRYANHKGGKKYETIKGKKTEIPRLEIADQDPQKARAAEIFAQELKIINDDKEYERLRSIHKRDYESKELDLSGIESIEGVPAKGGGYGKGEVGKRKRKREVKSDSDSETQVNESHIALAMSLETDRRRSSRLK